MRSILGTGACRTFIVLAALATPANVGGRIERVDGGELVVKFGRSRMSFKVDASTVVTLNGRPAALADLKVGDAAEVMADVPEDESPRATRIEATRPP